MDQVQELKDLLEERLRVIADSDFRNKDAEGHFNALRGVSERLDAWAKGHAVPPKLRHYLENASYQKALDFVRDKP